MADRRLGQVAPGQQPDTDSEVVTANQALQSALQNLNAARDRYNNAAVQRDQSLAGGYTTSADVAGSDVTKAVLQQFTVATDALAKAEQDYSRANQQLAIAYQNAASRAETPEQRQQRQAQSRLYDAQAKLAQAEADNYGAKTQADRQTSQAALINAQANAQKTASEIQTLLPAQAASLNSQALEASARASHLIPAQANAANAQAGLAGAQTQQVQAETQQLLPAQVKQILAATGYNEAQIKVIEQSLTRPTQIQAPPDQPNLAFQNPQTGDVSFIKNQNYRSAQAQLLQNQQDALDTIQGLLEKRLMSPAEATAYMDSVRNQTQAALRGTTPYQETLERNRSQEARAGIGRDILQNRLSSGTQLANSLTSTLLEAASKINVPGFDFSGMAPFAWSQQLTNQLGGGQQVADTAANLISGLGGPGSSVQVTQPSPMANAIAQASQQGQGPQSVDQLLQSLRQGATA